MQLIDILTDAEKEIGRQIVQGKTGTFIPVNYSNAIHAQSIIDKNVQKLKENSQYVMKIFFDIDFDGISSGYIFWRMLVELCQCDPTRIIPVINKERKHGITSSVVEEINNDQNTILTIIVDSSTNEYDTYTKLNCDLVIVDHHDVEIDTNLLSGQTAGGQYYIVNNTFDNVPAKSAAEVVYEFWFNISPSVLQSLMLEEWVAVSLYSDVIDTFTPQNVWFTSHLRTLRDNCDLMKILRPLDCVDVRDGHLALTKGSINFKLVPLINSCMRMQAGMDLILTIMYRPHSIATLKSCLTQQKELTSALLQAMSPKEFDDVVVAELKYTQQQQKSRSLLGLMQSAETTKRLNTYSRSVIDGFKGMIAGKISNDRKKTTFVYSHETIDGLPCLKGSVRTEGKFAGVKLRGLLATQPGWTASGHGDAFGFTYQLTEGKDESTLAAEVQALYPQLQQTTQHLTHYLLADYNLFYNLVQSTRPETIEQIRTIAEINNMKTYEDQYTFEIVPSGGFVQPLHTQETPTIHTFTWEGNGPLRLQLKSFDGLAALELTETYSIMIDSCDGNTLLGTISCISTK